MGVIEDLQKVLQTVVAPQMESITVRLDLLEKRGDRLEQRMDRLEQKIDRMEERMSRNLEDLSRQQQGFKTDIVAEIRQALNYQALSQRIELIEKKALS